MKEIHYRQELTFFFTQDEEQVRRNRRDRVVRARQQPAQLAPQRVALLGSGKIEELLIDCLSSEPSA